MPKPVGAGSGIQQHDRPQACGRYQDETRVIWINRMSHRKYRWRETRRENIERTGSKFFPETSFRLRLDVSGRAAGSIPEQMYIEFGVLYLLVHIFFVPPMAPLRTLSGRPAGGSFPAGPFFPRPDTRCHSVSSPVRCNHTTPAQHANTARAR